MTESGGQFRYAVLGAGLMGRAAAYDLLRHQDTETVLLADSNRRALDECRSFLGDKRLETVILEATDRDRVAALLARVDCAIAAMHYDLNLEFTRLAISTGRHLCDMGGNSRIVDRQIELNESAKKAGVSIIPDCGLAPGMVSVLVRWGIERFSWADTVRIRVGGLPQKPEGILKYGRLFSVEGLINEYIEPVRRLRNGKIEIIEPLTEVEEIVFPPPFGRLEAFTTSGGTSTLVDTYKTRLKELDYKTIRYPGHCVAVRAMLELGLFSSEPVRIDSAETIPRKLTAALIEKNIPLCHEDATLVRIDFSGGGKNHSLTIIDRATADPKMTSMMRMTAFPAAIISRMQALGKIEDYGVLPQEKCVPVDAFLKELADRSIIIDGIS